MARLPLCAVHPMIRLLALLLLIWPATLSAGTTTAALTVREAAAEATPCTGCAPLPGGLLARVRAYERSPSRVYKRWKKCTVGGPRAAPPAGTRTPEPRRCSFLVAGRYQVTCGQNWLLVRLALDPLTAPGVAARLLSESRSKCAKRPGTCRCPWRYWNDGDRRALCEALAPGGDA